MNDTSRRLPVILLMVVALSAAPALAAEPPEGWLQAGAAWAEMQADDSMIVGGGIGGGTVQGQEGRLQATALVLRGDGDALCFAAADVLMMNRDYLDQAMQRIATETGIPVEHILLNASHTHHAPSTVTIHGYQRDQVFCQRTVDALVKAAGEANRLALESPPAQPLFRLGQEATVGQNSRQLLKDGRIYWIGPRDDFVRPTGPFDVDLPVLAFRRADGSYAGFIFNHSTHCIGTRSGLKSPSFYGLAAQELADELGAPVVFLSGAAGSTHNLDLDCNEMVLRIKAAFKEALAKARPIADPVLDARKVEFEYTLRAFDEAREDAAVSEYCRDYAPSHADQIIQVFRDSRAVLKDQQGQRRSMWLQTVRIGDVYFAANPAEYFTALGLDIKRRSPFRWTFVCGLSNDYVGYLPNREGFERGGYQTWTGLHSFTAPGTGEAVADRCLELLQELADE